MKWFKHMNDLRHSPALLELRDRHGLSGYARALFVFEIVCAGSPPRIGRFHFTQPWREWAAALNLRTRKEVLDFLKKGQDIGLFRYKEPPGGIDVEVPLLQSLMDETREKYERRQTKSRESLGTDVGTQDIDTDRDRDTDPYTDEDKDTDPYLTPDKDTDSDRPFLYEKDLPHKRKGSRNRPTPSSEVGKGKL